MAVDIALNKQLTQGEKGIISLADYVWSFWKRRKGRGTESSTCWIWNILRYYYPPPPPESMEGKAGMDRISLLFYESLDLGVRYMLTPEEFVASQSWT